MCVAASSVFFTDKEIHVMYDLKGSHIGREASPEEKESEHPVLKDIDMEANKQKLELGPGEILLLLL